jgi:hypothetical protein
MTTNKTMASGNINNNFYTRFFQQKLKVEEHQQLLEEELGISNDKNLQHHRDTHCHNPSMETLDYGLVVSTSRSISHS